MKNRGELKEYFKSGKVPTEAQFAELIDSVVNIDDDGVIRTKQDGIVLYPEQEDSALASLFDVNMHKKPVQDESFIPPSWTLNIGDKRELLLKDERGTVILSIEQNRVASLYGSGIVEHKEKGNDEQSVFSQIPSDGIWHDLPVADGLRVIPAGYRIYNIFAVRRCHGREYDRMLEAEAGHSNGVFCQLSSSQKHWYGWCGPIRLRWKLKNGRLFLQMRGRRRKDSEIHYRIVTKWEY